MTTLAEQFLSAEERQTVTQAVQAAEKRTSGEIVAMIVSESHNYPVAPIVGGSRMLWKYFDELVIDGAVNGIGRLIRQFGRIGAEPVGKSAGGGLRVRVRTAREDVHRGGAVLRPGVHREM